MLPKKLFSVPVNELKFGVTKGGHVCHIISERDKKDGGIEIDENSYERLSSSRKVGDDISQAEIFSNSSDLKTKQDFLALAKRISDEYDKADSDEYKNILIGLKNYLTASTHVSQQEALFNTGVHMQQYADKLVTDYNKIDRLKIDNVEKEKRKRVISQKIAAFTKFKTEVQTTFDGNLKVSDIERDRRKQEIRDGKITEPKGDSLFDKAGIWTHARQQLFPHNPSPNDIKQGLGIQDCFMLSTLIQMAEKYPEKIKDSMRDNRDDTVTVRFFDKENGNKPVYVTVNKTVNQTAFGQNYYAASSLWVQMIEKAYVKFNEMRLKSVDRHDILETKSGSFSSINRSEPYAFLNAFTEEKFTSLPIKVPYSNVQIQNHLNGNKDVPDDDFTKRMPKQYYPEERMMFKMLKNGIEGVNGDPEIITVGIGKTRDGVKFDYKGIGLRPGHAYTLRKLVERDGKMYVQLRDPYASFKTGYDKSGKLVNKSHEVKATLGAGNDDMGNFEMELRDFLCTFDQFNGLSESMWHNMTNIKYQDYRRFPLSVEEGNGTVMIMGEEKSETLDFGSNEVRKNERKATAKNLDDEMKIFGEKYEANEEELIRDKEDSLTSWKDVRREMIMDKMFGSNQGFQSMLIDLKNQYASLKATDEFFVWTNTPKFTALRDSMKDIITRMEGCKTPNGELNNGISDEMKEVIAEKLMDIDVYAKNYIKEKGNEIVDNLSRKKKISDRAMLRLHAATSISSIADLDRPLEPLSNLKEKELECVIQDMNKRIDVIDGNISPEEKEGLREDLDFFEKTGDRKSLKGKMNVEAKDSLKKAVEAIKKYVDSKKPKISDNAKKALENVEKKVNKDDFEILDEPKAKNPEKENKEKVNEKNNQKNISDEWDIML